MKLVETSIRYPVTVIVAVLLAVFGGLLALQRVPIQLTPDIAKPSVTVTTFWPGASPEEIEKEIVEEQEELLKSLEGIEEMRSESRDSYGTVILEFAVGTDLTEATVRVTNKLSEVQSPPQDAEQPVVETVSRFERSIAWYVIIPAEGSDVDVPSLETFLDDTVKPRFERVEGVASVNFFGGVPQELHVTFDPALLASTGVTVPQLAAALRAESQDVSAGDFNEGKRRYVVRTMGRYRSVDDVRQTVVDVRGGVTIRVGDLADVEIATRKPYAAVRVLGGEGIAFNVQRKIGGNVLEIMDEIAIAEAEVQEQILAARGMRIQNVYRESLYIEESIERVMSNIYIGGFLAIAVLFLFLRSPTSIAVVAVAIPISIVTSFLALNLLGRTINVISLAGMAFAVGMVVDNAIVVLENIDRHLRMGKTRRRAAYDGTREVWGAVFASTITTVAVFLPILFIEERAGQLFRDIALAIAASVVVSLAVALTVIPTASARILKTAKSKSDKEPLIARLAERIARIVDVFNRTTMRRVVVTLTLVAVTVGATVLLMPEAEYLPNGNQSFISGFVLPPPGYNLAENMQPALMIERELGHLWEASDEDAASLPGGGAAGFWYAGLPEASFFGIEARDPTRVPELVGEVNRVLAQVPGAIAFAAQDSLFTDTVAGTRSVRIDVTGPELEEVLALAGRIFGEVTEKIPGSSSRPIPGLDLGNPEVRVYPDRVRAANAGFTSIELGRTVNSLVDGMPVAEYFHEGREIDVVLRGRGEFSQHTQSIAELPLATPSGALIMLGDIADVRQRQGPVQINHVERRRAVSIETALPDGVPLESAIARIRAEVVEPLRAEGVVGGLYEVKLRGAADDLSNLRQALIDNFVIVVVLTFLLLAALFQSFLYPVVILLTVPLATCGGVLGLRLVQLFVPSQQMDILTMLGFVILVGTVINNSILIVYQALQSHRDGLSTTESVKDAVRVRVRPIFMSTTTSSLGMLPLVVLPGAGSELYRGLGSVVVGGMVMSTIVTLVLTPLVFTFVNDLRAAVLGRFASSSSPESLDPATSEV